jgi:hypothetical protein
MQADPTHLIYDTVQKSGQREIIIRAKQKC